MSKRGFGFGGIKNEDSDKDIIDYITFTGYGANAVKIAMQFYDMLYRNEITAFGSGKIGKCVPVIANRGEFKINVFLNKRKEK